MNFIFVTEPINIHHIIKTLAHFLLSYAAKDWKFHKFIDWCQKLQMLAPFLILNTEIKVCQFVKLRKDVRKIEHGATDDTKEQEVHDFIKWSHKLQIISPLFLQEKHQKCGSYQSYQKVYWKNRTWLSSWSGSASFVIPLSLSLTNPFLTSNFYFFFTQNQILHLVRMQYQNISTGDRTCSTEWI